LRNFAVALLIVVPRLAPLIVVPRLAPLIVVLRLAPLIVVPRLAPLIVVLRLAPLIVIGGCADDGALALTDRPADLAVQSSADLTPPLNGCNGLLNCYITCNQSGARPSCFSDCDATGSSTGLDLLNAYGYCINTNCFQTSNADAGAPCSNTTVMSAGCQSCYHQILSNGGACYDAAAACVNNLP
jgi:hypothetical protein